MKKIFNINLLLALLLLISCGVAFGLSEAYKGNIYNPGTLKPTDSILKVRVGNPAPNFTLPSISGEKVTLSQFAGKKNVVISFVPAAWTPVCSDQWQGIILPKFFSTKTMLSCWALRWTIFQPFMPGPSRWENYGFQCFPISGPMVLWQPVTVFSVPTVSQKELCLL